jgi:hypothetical protein
MTIMTLVKAANAVLFCPVVDFSFLSTSRNQVISLQSRSSIRGFFPRLLPSYRRDNTTLGPIYDIFSVILWLLKDRKPPLTPQ